MGDEMVNGGYAAVGYNQINIDDCWMAKERSVVGLLEPDPSRFPNGIARLVDYMHSKQLKLGIYQNMGKKTCMGFPGSYGHLKADANTFADWKVDMVKVCTFVACNPAHPT